MNTKHTPGPWCETIPATGHRTKGIEIVTRGGQPIALTYWPDLNDYRAILPKASRYPETTRANAQLIAAAPDLLAAAEEVEAVIQGLKLDAALKTATDQLYAAIRKAKGDA